MKLESRGSTVAAAGAVVLLGALACGRAEGGEAPPPVFGGQGAVVTTDERPLPPEEKSAVLDTGPCAKGSPASDTPRLEDFEDGDARLFKAFQREGWWHSASDPTEGARIFPQGEFKAELLGGGEGSKENRYAAHFKAEGQKDWGATWGTTLRWTQQGIRCPFNASAFAGLKFKAKGPGIVRVNFGQPETLPPDGGGKCTAGCYDNYSKILTLSDRWEEYLVVWDRLQQGGWGAEARFDPARLLALNFSVDAKHLPVDFWIDELELIGPSATEPAKPPSAAR